MVGTPFSSRAFAIRCHTCSTKRSRSAYVRPVVGDGLEKGKLAGAAVHRELSLALDFASAPGHDRHYGDLGGYGEHERALLEWAQLVRQAARSLGVYAHRHAAADLLRRRVIGIDGGLSILPIDEDSGYFACRTAKQRDRDSSFLATNR